MDDGVFFCGTTQISLDSKGRLAVPARYRKCIQENNVGQLVVTRSLFDRCLWLYRKEQFDEVTESLGSLPVLSDPICRTIQRVILGSAVYLQLDSQGRILLPQELRALCGIEKKVFLIGLNNKFEIRSEENFKACIAEDENKLKAELSSLESHSVLSDLRL